MSPGPQCFHRHGLRQRVGLAAVGEVSNPSSSTMMCIHCRLPSVEFPLWPTSQNVPPFPPCTPVGAHTHGTKALTDNLFKEIVPYK